MAVSTNTAPLVNGTSVMNKPLELAIDLPQNLGTRVNIHLTIHAASVQLFLSTTHADAADSATTMGSFVYAMPDRYNPSQPMSTALYSVPSSLDFTTRMAKVLVRRLSVPCYVGGSLNLANAAGGGTVEEEMEAFRAIVAVVVSEYEKAHE